MTTSFTAKRFVEICVRYFDEFSNGYFSINDRAELISFLESNFINFVDGQEGSPTVYGRLLAAQLSCFDRRHRITSTPFENDILKSVYLDLSVNEIYDQIH